jgi:capsular polysaccharide export protein
MEQIAVLTQGLWKLRREIGALTGMAAVRWDRLPRPAISAVAGWGHKDTASRARRLASRTGQPYWAFEDGPLRSIRPGPGEPPMSMVLDRSGIYYDAAGPSDLLAMAADRAWFTPAVAQRAGRGIDQLAALRLSKYNAGPEHTPEQLGLSGLAPRRVLVLDQVENDASIQGALADAHSFQRMLAAALTDNPDAEIVVKLHPAALSGRRIGYFSALTPGGRLKLLAASVSPWSLLDAVDTVYTVSSGLGFEAVLAGKRVVCFGSPFYSGWGFTVDRGQSLARPGPASAPEIFAAYYLRYAHYFDTWSRREISFESACDQLAWRRDRFHAQEKRAVCYRIAGWKRRSVERMLDSPAGPPLQASSIQSAVALARSERGQVVAWASRGNPELAEACSAAGVPLTHAEDGFIRSAGLGASFVQPLSLVFDERGIYYDSRAASDLEALLQDQAFTPELLHRARRLREQLIATGTTKYNLGAAPPLTLDSGGRPIVLVTGQVEDDASILQGSPRIRRNLDLLRAVRERHPAGFIVYKPHPDVAARFRSGHVPPELAATLADRVETEQSILPLIELCDSLETMTSLAGFEALLRGKAVTTHGQPFYAGWGLTQDLCPPPRRGRRLGIDELVAAALILYPRYLDPVSGLPCPPEVLIERLAMRRQEPSTRRRALREIQILLARALHLARAMKARLPR